MRVILPEGSFEWDLDTFNAVSSKTILRRYRHPSGLRVTTHRDFDRFSFKCGDIADKYIIKKPV